MDKEKSTMFNITDTIRKIAENTKELVVFDLDGTLVANEGLSYPTKDYFTAKIHPELLKELRSQQARKNTTIIFVTGREELYRPETVKWLKQHGLENIELKMRRSGVPTSYAGRFKGRQIAKKVREGGFKSVRMYEDHMGFLTSVGSALSPLNVEFTKILCLKGSFGEVS